MNQPTILEHIVVARPEQYRAGKQRQLERLYQLRQDHADKYNERGFHLIDVCIVSTLVALRRLDA